LLSAKNSPLGYRLVVRASKQLSTMFRSAFPDFKVTLDDMIAEGDKVVVRSTWSGTHKGEFMGIPPTGKKVSFGVIDIIRMAGGKAVEHWARWIAWV